ncbi:MAG: UDP-3-O-(3-hydroxymyristoyl)glucosamine N-acyltransferase [Deltaproteobacteria bacterium]|nr:UDP-3-O-(3-hydroxymyristoyl)glucosamine N-acyltransferase [Deltaproteobacteria bacterium]
MAITLKKIAEMVGGTVSGDENVLITGVGSLTDATRGDISLFYDYRYREYLKKTKASALLVSKVTALYKGPQVMVSNPLLSYARVAALFAVPTPTFPGISERATIHESSVIGNNVSIYPFVYVGENASIGDHAILFPGVFVGDRVRIGERTIIHPNVSIMHDCVIGKEVIIHAGAVIGSDGFGFVRDGSTNVKIPQMGFVQIDDQVEIGANCCVDRAATGKTWIKKGVKTDNLVQVAHNVTIGKDTVIVAQSALGGSVSIGDSVIIGGQSAISDHVKIGDRAMIGSKSGVAKSLPPGEIVSGVPAMPHRIWLKTRGLITKLPDLVKRLRVLEKRVDELERSTNHSGHDND